MNGRAIARRWTSTSTVTTAPGVGPQGAVATTVATPVPPTPIGGIGIFPERSGSLETPASSGSSTGVLAGIAATAVAAALALGGAAWYARRR